MFVLFLIISGSAQTNFQKLKKALESVPIVVEGEIIRQSCFKDESSGRIFTKNYLLPKVIFKGATNRDSIIFLTRGGRVGDIISTVSHSVQVSKNQEGVFLLYPSRAISNHYEISSYIERLTYDRAYEAYFEGGHEKDPSWRLMREEVGRICEKDVTVRPISSQELNVLDIPEFCIKLANPILDALNKKVTFDVKAKSNIAGLEFARADIPLKYPEELLGSNVVLNGKVEAAKAESTNTSFYDLNIHDIVDDKFMLTLSSNCNGGESGFVLGTEFEKIAKVTVEVQEFGNLGTINAESFDVNGFAKYFLDGSCQEFIEKCVEGQIPLGTCTISSITTKPFAAGIGQTLTFIGSGFGLPASGIMKVPNADNGGTTKIAFDGTNSKFIDSWQPDKIVVNILSRTSPNDGTKWPMGSGVWEIFAGTDFCSESVDIEYGVKTKTRSGDGKNLMIGLAFDVSPTNPSGTYQWWLHDFVPPILEGMGVTIDDIELIAEDAYCDWEVSAGIDFQYMGRTSTPPTIADDKSVIGFGVIDANKSAQTSVSSKPICTSDSYFASQFNDADIELNQGLNWYVSEETSISSSQQDLYSTLLHEIGHGILLQHSMDEDYTPGNIDDRVMYYIQKPKELRRWIDAKTESGITYLVDKSKQQTQTTSGCFWGLQIDTDFQIFCTPTSIENIEQKPNYRINTLLSSEREISIYFDEKTNHDAFLFSLSGSIIACENGRSQITFDVSSLSAGKYFLSIQSASGSYFEKIVIQ
ncbi:MAG TPA: T9SS type A sorting domain-containing protein [Saprospiraceae bacterium]|nr:T9SS type A sorting domain-containing protein [Saprospiraceae bacterium]